MGARVVRAETPWRGAVERHLTRTEDDRLGIGRPQWVPIAPVRTSGRHSEQRLAIAAEPIDADGVEQVHPGGYAGRVGRPRDEPALARDRGDGAASWVDNLDGPATAGSIGEVPPVGRPRPPRCPKLLTAGSAVRWGTPGDPDGVPAIPVGYHEVIAE